MVDEHSEPQQRKPWYHTEEARRAISKGVSIANIGNQKRAKQWLVTNPDGSKLIVKNLKRFCKNKWLDYEALRQGSENCGYRAVLANRILSE